MKRNFKRRKHRNGKRPERKGSIRISLQELPGARNVFDLFCYCNDLQMRHFKKMPDFPYLTDFKELNTPEYQHKFHTYEREMKQWREDDRRLKTTVAFYRRGNDFLCKNKQVSTADLALDVINEVQPKAPVFFYIEDHCAKCKQSKRCPLMKLDYLERSERCKKLVAAYEKVDEELRNGTFQKPMNYYDNWQSMIAEAWEIPNN